MNVPEELRYTEEHEWVLRQDDGLFRVGITDYAQDALGDVVYVDLPDVGRTVLSHEVFGEVESTKSVSELFAPIAGTVVAVNEKLVDAPEVINDDPYGEGWLIVIEAADEQSYDELLDAGGYADLTS